MTRKVFWENPYLTELETTVTSVDNNDITVEHTIFYAQSGGQESDHGTINNYRVIQARKEGREIIYTLENSHELRLNDRVKMVID
jgi:alanyl-tRNA synthetase